MEDLLEQGFDPQLVRHDSSVDLNIADGAFKQGGERNVFQMHFCSHERSGKLRALANDAWVVKEDKHRAAVSARGEADELEFHRKSLVTQTLSAYFSKSFNEEVQRLGLEGVPKVAFMSCCYIETEAKADGSKRCLFAEKHLCGAFRKWNSNSGHVIQMRPPSQSGDRLRIDGSAGAAPRKQVLFSLGAVAEEEEEPERAPEAKAVQAGDEVVRDVPTDDVAQAFSHWTYSGKPLEGPDGKRGQVLICDIQGHFNELEQTFRLIDPVVHSVGLSEKKGLFGDTDRGQKGISDFFASHRCNCVCKLLNLPPNDAFVADNIHYCEAVTTRTSLITITRRDHARKQQDKREITTKLLQRAIKYGQKFPGTGDNTIKHRLRTPEGEDISYVTSADGRLGVTAIDHRRKQQCWYGPNCKRDRCPFLHGPAKPSLSATSLRVRSQSDLQPLPSAASAASSASAASAASASTSSPRNRDAPAPSPRVKVQRPCKFYGRNGFCRFGDKCMFVHESFQSSRGSSAAVSLAHCLPPEPQSEPIAATSQVPVSPAAPDEEKLVVQELGAQELRLNELEKEWERGLARVWRETPEEVRDEKLQWFTSMPAEDQDALERRAKLGQNPDAMREFMADVLTYEKPFIVFRGSLRSLRKDLAEAQQKERLAEGKQRRERQQQEALVRLQASHVRPHLSGRDQVHAREKDLIGQTMTEEQRKAAAQAKKAEDRQQQAAREIEREKQAAKQAEQVKLYEEQRLRDEQAAAEVRELARKRAATKLDKLTATHSASV